MKAPLGSSLQHARGRHAGGSDAPVCAASSAAAVAAAAAELSSIPSAGAFAVPQKWKSAQATGFKSHSYTCPVTKWNAKEYTIATPNQTPDRINSFTTNKDVN